MVEFASALDAVRCAYDIQRTVRELNIAVPEERRIVLRIGVHLGDVVSSEGDISGDAVNIASRSNPWREPGVSASHGRSTIKSTTSSRFDWRALGRSS